MKMLTYPQVPIWSYPITPQLFSAPQPWLTRFSRPRRTVDSPVVTPHLSAASTAAAGETRGSLTQVGENHRAVERVRECVVIRQRGRQVLTALRNSDNHLQLFSWRVNADGSVMRIGESGVQPETITQLDVAHAAKFVVACRTTDQRLKLISWNVSSTGVIYRAGESQTQPAQLSAPISKVKLVALDQEVLLTAAVTAAGELQLISWQLDASAALRPLRQQTGRTEPLRELALLRLPSPDATSYRVMSVARTRRGTLHLQVWQVTPAGEITLLGQTTAPEECGTQIQAVVNEQGVVITSLRTASGHLRLCSWRVNAAGNQIEQLAHIDDSDDNGARIRQQRLLLVPGGVISALTLPHGRLQLLAWEITADGQMMRRHLGTPIAATSHNLALCPELLDGNAPILTSLCTAQGEMKLMTWRG